MGPPPKIPRFAFSKTEEFGLLCTRLRQKRVDEEPLREYARTLMSKFLGSYTDKRHNYSYDVRIWGPPRIGGFIMEYAAGRALEEIAEEEGIPAAPIGNAEAQQFFKPYRPVGNLTYGYYLNLNGRSMELDVTLRNADVKLRSKNGPKHLMIWQETMEETPRPIMNAYTVRAMNRIRHHSNVQISAAQVATHDSFNKQTEEPDAWNSRKRLNIPLTSVRISREQIWAIVDDVYEELISMPVSVVECVEGHTANGALPHQSPESLRRLASKDIHDTSN